MFYIDQEGDFGEIMSVKKVIKKLFISQKESRDYNEQI
jgi:hypothetical protein